MEKNKKGFVMYLDYEKHFNLLSDAELGQLLRIIYEFERTEKIPVIENKTIEMAFSFIVSQLERDNQKYEETIKKRKAAGLRGAENRWQDSKEMANGKSNMANDSKRIAKMANAKNAIAKNGKRITKIANDNKRINSMAKMADTDKDTVTDKVTVTDTVKDINKKEEGIDAVAVDEIIKYINKDSKEKIPAAAVTPFFEFQLPVEMIKMAIDTAIFRGHRTLDYVYGILRDWSNKGFKNLNDIEVERKQVSDSCCSNLDEIYEN